jgi:UDP-GlcNAc:undecaprenyl-phosphate/decaprenyl-phosphate GlcNAc-1-phosphate transferase
MDLVCRDSVSYKSHWKYAAMRSFLVVFILALAITGVSTPWFRRMAVLMGFVDAPGSRKVHRDPTPLLGGIAIFAGAIVATLAIYGGRVPQQVAGPMIAGALVATVGLLDDRRQLPPWVRLTVQFLAFLMLVYFGIHVRLPVPMIVNYALTLFWLLGITNAINLMDNMDGLSAGVSGVAAAFMMLMGAMNNQFLVAALAAALLGACLGFLRYNFAPANIFMGDAGAYFLGFWLAVLGLQLRFVQNVNFVTWMVPVLILWIPIFDTGLVVLSRLRRGVHPFTAGKDHLSHRLVARGMAPREAVLLIYLLAGILGMVALFITQATIVEGYFIGAVVLSLSAYAFWKLDVKKVDEQIPIEL